MYSLNVPVPSAVGALAGDLARRLPGARARARGEHTLVCKRLGDGSGGRGGRDRYHELEARARDALRGAPAFEARVAGVDRFETAERGTSPVVYLAVESPGLERLHRRLCEAFDPVDGLEGEAYVPHVTVARGGSTERAREVCETEIDPIEWTVDRLEILDAERSQPVSTVSLPA